MFRILIANEMFYIQHLAYEYAKRGAILVLVERRVKSLNEVAMRCREIGSPSVLVVPADVSKPNHCQRFIYTTITNFGRCKFNCVY